MENPSAHIPRRVSIHTVGCRLNQAETALLVNRFRNKGYQLVEYGRPTDLLVLNTCSVRKTAENRIWGRLGFFKSQKQQKSFKLALIGCMAERLKEEIFTQAPY